MTLSSAQPNSKELIYKIKIADKVRALGVLDVLTKAQLTPTEVVNKIRQLI